jgi:hypothetical protein
VVKVNGPKIAPRAPVEDGDRADVSESAEDLQTSLDYAATYTSAPSGRSGDPLERGASIDEPGRDLGGSIGDGTRAAAGGLSTGGVWGSATVETGREGGERVGADVYYEPGWLSGGGSHEWATSDGGRRAGRAGIALWDGGLGASAGFDVTRPDGSGHRVGAFVGIDADRAIMDLGEQDDGKRRIEVKRTSGGRVLSSPGVFTDAVGLGFRLGGGKKREVIYRTNVTDDDARALLTERQGIVGWARDTARGLGVADDPVTIPDLRAPETLAVGDEVVTTASGELQAGLFVGGLPFRVGAQGRVRGEFEIGVKRLDEHRVSFVVTPRDVTGLMARVGVPIALDGDVSRTSARALRQAFVFDLREPDARKAYERALDGELPGGVPGDSKPADDGDALSLRAAIESEQLGDGVTRSYAELVEAKRTQVGLGFAVGLWHRSGPFVGLGQQNVSESAKSEVVTDAGVWTRDVRGTERRRQLLISGEEKRGVYAALKRATLFDERGEKTDTFGGLTLQLRLADSRVRGLELNDDVIDVLNDALGLSLAPFSRGGRKKSREVNVRRTLQADDLARLAAAVQSFIADAGLRGFAAVCAALGGGRDDYDLQTTASAYDDPVARAVELELEHHEPVTRDADKGALTRRFADAHKALTEVNESLLDARADPLLGDREAEQVLRALEEARDKLRAVVDVSHLTRADKDVLAERLDRGWTTGAQHRIIKTLRS